MRYLAKITGLPKTDTGIMNVIVPSKSDKEVREAHPLKPYLGLYEPYKLGDIVVVEIIEGRLYYGDRTYALGEFPMTVPKGAYAYVTPYGYLAFTPEGVTLKHINGGELTLTTQKLTPSIVEVDAGSHKSTPQFIRVDSGSSIGSPAKWR